MRIIHRLSLEGKNVAITGGYGHLGVAIVDSLVAHGANVSVFGKDEDKFYAASFSPNVQFVQCDLADAQQVKSSIKKVVDRYDGKLAGFINNAFFLQGQSPINMTDSEWATGIDGTLATVFRCTREVTPFMIKQGFGKIVNVSSMYGLVAPDFSVYDESPEFLNPPHYGAAKAGVLQLTRYYAGYLGTRGICVNSVTPGPFPNENVKRNRPFVERLEKHTMVGRVGSPEDVAGVFVFLMSDASNFVTGQNFIVDGGWTAR
jgi:NAD(P)-dependent dehydrogenase (short-subunit alcohol dehydrogenase family)